MDIRFMLTARDDPYRNLATEELLLENCGDCTLFLWQNAETVVIGRNQNPWSECRLDAMRAAGCRLARRNTGGGAVYHDVGNLNFSFLARRGVYDKERQLRVILNAVATLGIEAELSGRNDIVTSDGAKFSGSAYLERKDACLHHGTLLINADMARLGGYLTPPKDKYESKGVKSVRARVVNLKELNPQISVPRLAGAVVTAFEDEYGDALPLSERDLDGERIAALTERNASDEWLYGTTPPFTVIHEKRLALGRIKLLLNVKHGFIENAAAESDAMDADMIANLAADLAGRAYTPSAMAEAAEGEVAQWLKSIEI